MNIKSRLFYAALAYYPVLDASVVETFMAGKDYTALVTAETQNYSTVVEEEVNIVKNSEGKVITRLGGNPDITEQINNVADEKVFNTLLNDFLDYVYNSLISV